MKRALITLTLAAAVAGGSGAALQADPKGCPGRSCEAPGHWKFGHHDHGQDLRDSARWRGDYDEHDDRDRHARRVPPGHAPTVAQLRRLPPLRHGREYRIVHDKVIVIDSDTYATVAALGLLFTLLNN